nr:Leu2 [Homo sapiens]
MRLRFNNDRMKTTIKETTILSSAILTFLTYLMKMSFERCTARNKMFVNSPFYPRVDNYCTSSWKKFYLKCYFSLNTIKKEKKMT